LMRSKFDEPIERGFEHRRRVLADALVGPVISSQKLRKRGILGALSSSFSGTRVLHASSLSFPL
jgi:hypothetical protein